MDEKATTRAALLMARRKIHAHLRKSGAVYTEILAQFSVQNPYDEAGLKITT